ncbi:YibE/F family protein [Salidesulfovibrio onnuriiensis]|uniref:YibE/F family protein n=1 Tax=Salidesulfovibrio onnuriiensis TaxID=2583823 RepID=UPI0011CC0C3E|nr:YibE/F family protein [Salidesulfovibrio onnuriiensis]
MKELFVANKRNIVLVSVFCLLTIALYLLPTGFEGHVKGDSIRCRARVLEVDNSRLHTYGMVRKGEQGVSLEMLNGPFKGERFDGHNQLLGQMDRDKLFRVGDTALAVLGIGPQGELLTVNPVAHYRLDLELLLLGLFAVLLVLFGGWVGAKALLSFLFTALAIWKVLIPLLLKGADPILLSLGVVACLCGAIIFLVAGITRTGVVAFLGAFLGVFSSCLMAMFFTGKFHVHGAVMPFAETLLYSGYGHLDLAGIYIAAVFIASSGAVMDLAMDVAASMGEVVSKKPDITRAEAFGSGLRVGRAVVGTMTTTLLLAYSGGFITLLMAFMAQGIPLANTFNFIYVAAEVLKTLVGSFGLVLVAPFSALVGAVLFTRKRETVPLGESATEQL